MLLIYKEAIKSHCITMILLNFNYLAALNLIALLAVGMWPVNNNILIIETV